MLTWSLGNLTKFAISYTPVGDVVDEVLLEHVAPLFDLIQECLFERLRVYPQPVVEHLRQQKQIYNIRLW